MMKYKALSLTLVALLLITVATLAMSSNGYMLDWFTPLTSNGAGVYSSTNHIINVTVGQSVIGQSTGANQSACLGYWCYLPTGSRIYRIYLPIIIGS